MISEQMRAYLEKNHSAAMTTLTRDGTPHTVRVGVALVDGKIWSSGTQARLRTVHVRRDPRSTLFVFDDQWSYLTLECRVAILEGPDVPEQSIRLFEVMQRNVVPPPSSGMLLWYGREVPREEFRQLMDVGGIGVAQVDVTRVGGLARSKRIGWDSAERHRLCVNHSYKTGINIAASLHFVAALPNTHYFEYCVEQGPLRQMLTRQRFPVVEGDIVVPEGPGLGIELDEDVVAKYRVA